MSLRKKSEIIETLPKAINNSDKKHVKSMFRCHGNIVKNSFVSDDNPAEYVGWLRTDSNEVMRIEGESKKHDNGKITLSIKGVTIPNTMAVELDLDEPQIPEYQSQQTRDFLSQ